MRKALLFLIFYLFIFSLKAQDLSAVVTINSPAGCNSGAEILVLAEGGDGNYEYAVTIAGAMPPTNNEYSSSSIITGLPSGVYDVYVKDSLGETIFTETIVDPPLNPEFTAIGFDATCDGNSDGYIEITEILVGVTPISYQLVDANTLLPVAGVAFDSNSYTFINVYAGSYMIIATGANGCQNSSSIITIHDFDQLVISNPIVEQFGCSSENTLEEALITFDYSSISGGSRNYVVELYKDLGFVGPSVDDIEVTEFEVAGTNYIFSISDVTGGDYYVNVIDSEGCNAISETVTVNPYDELEAFAEVLNNVSCNGVDDGSVQVDISGGVPPYQVYLYGTVNETPPFSDFTSDSSFVFPGVPADSYIVEIIDENDCAVQQLVTITEPSVIVIPTPVVEQFGCSSGNIINPAGVYLDKDNITGGSGNYIRAVFTYTPAEGTVEIQDSSSFIFNTTNDSGGTVNVVVYDDSGCSSNLSVTINTFNELNNPLVLVNKAIDCVSGEDISVFVDLEGDLLVGEEIVFEISGPSSIETNTLSGPVEDTNIVTNFTGLLEGSYLISIRNLATGCELTTTHVVDPLPSYNVLAVTTSPVSCVGDSNGTASVSFDSSTPYWGSYSCEVLDVNNQILVNSSVGNIGEYIITGLPAGDYYTVVSQLESPFCSIVSNTFSIEEPPVLDFTTSAVDLTCVGSNNGSISIMALGGWGGYEFSIDGGTTWQTSNTFTGLGAGSYMVYVRDINNCIVSSEVTIIEPEQLSLVTSITNPTCYGESDGVIEVEANGGVPPYEFSIDGGATWQTSNVFSDLLAGEYNIEIRDANSCALCGCATNPFENGSFEDTTSLTDTNLNLLNSNGYLIVDESELNGWQTTAADNALEIFKTGFQGRVSYEGDYYAELNANITSIDQVLYQEFCTKPGDVIQWKVAHRGRNGIDVAELRIGGTVDNAIRQDVTDINGNVTTYMETGTTGGDSGTGWKLYYGTYIVPENQFSTVILFEAISTANGNLAVGNLLDAISIQMIDSTCGSIPVVLGSNTEVELNVISGSITCNGDNNGVISADVIDGGLGTYMYELYENNLAVGNPQTDNTFFGLGAGEYFIRVYTVDSNGNNVCPVDTEKISIVNPEEIQSMFTVTSVSCNGEEDGIITVSTEGGTLLDSSSNYVYFLSNNPDRPYAGETFIDETRGVVFEGLAPGNYEIIVQDDNGCIEFITDIEVNSPVEMITSINELSTGVVEVIVIGGTPPYKYSIDGGSYQTNNTFTDLIPGVTYTVEVKDSNNCVSSNVFEIEEDSLSSSDFTTNSFAIYPNPADEFITVPSILLNKKYQIFDITSKRLKVGKIDNEKIDVSSLEEGIYLLKVDNYTTVKIIKE